MTDKPLSDNALTAKQQAFCEHYTDKDNKETYHNALQSAKSANYKGNKDTLKQVGCENLTKPYIMTEITRIRAENKEKLAHDHDINLRLLNEQLDHLAPAVEQGNIQAIQARTAVLRELNASNGMHSSTIRNENSNADSIPRTAQEQAATEEAITAYHRSMSLNPSTDKEIG